MLFEMSQRHFELADRMVMSAEEYADTKLIVSISFYLAVLLFSVAIYLTVGRRGRAAVEKEPLQRPPDRHFEPGRVRGRRGRAAAPAAGRGNTACWNSMWTTLSFLNSTYGYELGNELLWRWPGR